MEGNLTPELQKYLITVAQILGEPLFHEIGFRFASSMDDVWSWIIHS
jgi:hypothetical protein